LENELTKEIYKSSSKINNCLNRIKLPEMKEFSSKKTYDYIDTIIEDYENIKENAYLVVPQINYTMDLNIEDSSSEELIPSRKTKILRTMALRSGNITHMKHITQRINILPERTIRIITTF
ncbi:hypothetical protein E3228_16450, partial [Shigella flexneri]|nr:hypothetical protein [Shigella flexneri]EFW9656716.1 hypothetical protein [Shigella flexneri]